jgi:F420-dependent oxidoreductase-like protein
MSIKFGVQVSQSDIEWSDLLSIWQELDESNFDSAWTMDHFVSGRIKEEAGGPCLESWTTLAALAQATSRIRIGCLVSGLTHRHPVVLAKMATTVDIISNGRLEFGIGAGWHEYEHQAYGIPFYTVKERQDRLNEAIQLIKALWTSKPANFRGKYYQLNDAPYSPPNVQKPHPPIMVGGGGEKRTLRTAARYADAINVIGGPDMFRHKIEVLKAHCREVGRDPSEIRLTALIPLLGDANSMKATVQSFLDVGIQEIIVFPSPPVELAPLRRFSEEIIPAFR